MLNPERTFEIKVRSHRTVLEIFLTSAVICIIFKTTSITKLTQGHPRKLM